MGRYVAPELAALWLTDLVLAFIVVYLITASPAPREVLGASLQALDSRLVDHAVLLASMLGASAIIIGLYRPDICLEPRRVAMNAAVAAIIAFPLALAIGGIFTPGLTGTYAARLVGVLISWVACVPLTRWALRSTVSPSLLVRRVLIVGASEQAGRLVAALRTRRGAMFELAGTVDIASTPPSLAELRLPAYGRWSPSVHPSRLRQAGFSTTRCAASRCLTSSLFVSGSSAVSVSTG